MRLPSLCWIAVTGLPVYASADALTLLTTQTGSRMLWNSGYRRRALPASVLVCALLLLCALVFAVEAAERAGEHAAKTAARAVQVSEGAPIPERSAVSCGITDERSAGASAAASLLFCAAPPRRKQRRRRQQQQQHRRSRRGAGTATAEARAGARGRAATAESAYRAAGPRLVAVAAAGVWAPRVRGAVPLPESEACPRLIRKR